MINAWSRYNVYIGTTYLYIKLGMYNSSCKYVVNSLIIYSLVVLVLMWYYKYLFP